MSKRHTVTLHHVITVDNDMFDHINSVMRASTKMETQWKEDLYFAMKFACQKVSKHYVEVTPTTGMLLIAAHIVESLWKLRFFRKLDKGLHIDPDDRSSNTTQYQEAFLEHVENEYCTRHRPVPVIKPKSIPSKILFSAAIALISAQSSDDAYDLSRDDAE